MNTVQRLERVIEERKQDVIGTRTEWRAERDRQARLFAQKREEVDRWAAKIENKGVQVIVRAPREGMMSVR